MIKSSGMLEKITELNTADLNKIGLLSREIAELFDYGITETVYEDYNLKIFDRHRLICECIKHENKMDRGTYYNRDSLQQIEEFFGE